MVVFYIHVFNLFSILESVTVFDEISLVHASFDTTFTHAVTAETFNCICVHAQESVSLLLQQHTHSHTMATPIHLHTCLLCMNLPFKVKISCTAAILSSMAYFPL